MQGNLYKIINDINSKIYIGKTYKTLNERWKGHLNSAFKLNENKTDYEYNYKLYKAIRKYGVEHFQIILINKFEEGILEQKEIEYIQKYDSYRNGYNSTLGGDGNKRELKLEMCSESIIELYNKGISIENIALSMDTSRNSVLNILKKFNIEIRHETYREDTRIVMYDKYFNPIKVFENKISVADWIITETDFAYYQRTLYTALSNSCKTGCIRYGHRWQMYSDLLHDNKVFRSKFDKEAYIEGKDAYQPDGKQYWIVDGALEQIVKIQKTTKTVTKTKAIIRDKKESKQNNKDTKLSISGNNRKVRCVICGKEITERALTGMCNSCANVDAKGKSPKPSKEELKALLDSKMQTKQIAELYDRSPGTVSVWIKSYGLK